MQVLCVIMMTWTVPVAVFFTSIIGEGDRKERGEGGKSCLLLNGGLVTLLVDV